MSTMSRMITGTTLIILGITLIIISFLKPFLLIYGIPALIFGIFILFNKNEDKIEQIKRR